MGFLFSATLCVKAFHYKVKSFSTEGTEKRGGSMFYFLLGLTPAG